MGCGNGVVALALVRDLLKAHPGANAVLVATETVTPACYRGFDKHRLVTNVIFRRVTGAGGGGRGSWKLVAAGWTAGGGDWPGAGQAAPASRRLLRPCPPHTPSHPSPTSNSYNPPEPHPPSRTRSMGAAAMLFSNKPAAAAAAKYELRHIERVHNAASDPGYRRVPPRLLPPPSSTPPPLYSCRCPCLLPPLFAPFLTLTLLSLLLTPPAPLNKPHKTPARTRARPPPAAASGTAPTRRA